MRHRPSEAIKLPHDHYIEAPLVCVGHEPVELRALVFTAADSKVEVGIDQTPAARQGELLKVARLYAHILAVICGGNPSVDCDAGYTVRSHVTPPLCHSVRAAPVF